MVQDAVDDIEVDMILVAIEQLNAEQSQKVIQGMATQAKIVGQIEPTDNAWVVGAAYLIRAAFTISKRRGN